MDIGSTFSSYEDLCRAVSDYEKTKLVQLLHKFFTPSGRRRFTDRLKYLKNMDWLCGSCVKSLKDVRSIGCDMCLSFYHYSCQFIYDTPLSELWFCKGCIRKY